MEKFYYKSFIGLLEITCENNNVTNLKLADKLVPTSPETNFAQNVKRQLDEYFAGKNHHLDIKINPAGTAFQKLVWRELQKIPYGETRSYSEIAEAIGNKNAQRAVGSACNKNPILIIIPCHRIIHQSGDLGGFAYGGSIKEKLLELEGWDKFSKLN